MRSAAAVVEQFDLALDLEQGNAGAGLRNLHDTLRDPDVGVPDGGLHAAFGDGGYRRFGFRSVGCCTEFAFTG